MELTTKTLYSSAAIRGGWSELQHEESPAEILLHYSNKDPLVIKILIRLRSGEVRKEYVSRSSLFSSIDNPGEVVIDGVWSFCNTGKMLCISKMNQWGLFQVLLSGNVVQRAKAGITEKVQNELVAFDEIFRTLKKL